MDDLISREKALEELEDWERCYTWDEHCRESKEDYIVSPSDVIVNLPSEQPEIIRCEDCMHNGSFDTDCPILWKGKEYCSFAERIEDGKET
jgi:hypothetical protein